MISSMGSSLHTVLKSLVLSFSDSGIVFLRRTEFEMKKVIFILKNERFQHMVFGQKDTLSTVILCSIHTSTEYWSLM